MAVRADSGTGEIKAEVTPVVIDRGWTQNQVNYSPPTWYQQVKSPTSTYTPPPPKSSGKTKVQVEQEYKQAQQQQNAWKQAAWQQELDYLLEPAPQPAKKQSAPKQSANPGWEQELDYLLQPHSTAPYRPPDTPQNRPSAPSVTGWSPGGGYTYGPPAINAQDEQDIAQFMQSQGVSGGYKGLQSAIPSSEMPRAYDAEDERDYLRSLSSELNKYQPQETAEDNRNWWQKTTDFVRDIPGNIRENVTNDTPFYESLAESPPPIQSITEVIQKAAYYPVAAVQGLRDTPGGRAAQMRSEERRETVDNPISVSLPEKLIPLAGNLSPVVQSAWDRIRGDAESIAIPNSVSSTVRQAGMHAGNALDWMGVPAQAAVTEPLPGMTHSVGDYAGAYMEAMVKARDATSADETGLSKLVSAWTEPGTYWSTAAKTISEELSEIARIRGLVNEAKVENPNADFALLSALSGSERMENSLDAIVARPSKVQSLENQARLFYAQANDPGGFMTDEERTALSQKAAEAGRQAYLLRTKSDLDLVEENQIIWRQLVGEMTVDPLNFADGAVAAFRLTPAARRVAQATDAVDAITDFDVKLMAQSMEGSRLLEEANLLSGSQAKTWTDYLKLGKKTAETRANQASDAFYKTMRGLLYNVDNKGDAKRIVETFLDKPELLDEGLQFLSSKPIVAEVGPDGKYKFSRYTFASTDIRKYTDEIQHAADSLRVMPSLKGGGTFDFAQFLSEADAAIFKSARDIHGVSDDKSWIRRFTNFQRALMSEIQLNMKPGNWVENGASAAGHLIVDRTMTFVPIKRAGDEIMRKTGVMPTVRSAGLERVGGAARNATQYNTPSKSLFRNLTLGKGNPLSWWAEGGAGVRSRTEESFYTRAFYTGFKRVVNEHWPNRVNSVFLPQLVEAGMDPEVAQTIANTMIDMGVAGNRSDIAKAVRQQLDTAAHYPTLEGLGIRREQLTEDARRAVISALQNAPEYGPEGFKRLIDEALDADVTDYLDMLNEVPPSQGRSEWTKFEVEKDGGEAIAGMVRAAGELGRNTEEVRKEFTALVKKYQDESSFLMQQVIDEAVEAGRPDALNVAMDTFIDMSNARQAAREKQSTWAQMAIERQQGYTWETYFQNMTQMYQEELLKEVEKITYAARSQLKNVEEGFNYPRKRGYSEVVDRLANMTDEKIKEYRQLQPGRISESAGMFDAKVRANRALVDLQRVRMYETFNRFPSQDSLDLIMSADRDIRIFDMRANAYIRHHQPGAGATDADWEAFFKLRNDTWDELAQESAIIYQSTIREMVREGGLNGSDVGKALKEIRERAPKPIPAELRDFRTLEESEAVLASNIKGHRARAVQMEERWNDIFPDGPSLEESAQAYREMDELPILVRRKMQRGMIGFRNREDIVDFLHEYDGVRWELSEFQQTVNRLSDIKNMTADDMRVFLADELLASGVSEEDILKMGRDELLMRSGVLEMTDEYMGSRKWLSHLDLDNVFEDIKKTNKNRSAAGGEVDPSIGDIAEFHIKDREDARQKLKAAANEAVQGIPNKITEQQRLKAIDLVTKFLPQFDDVVQGAVKAGESLGDFAMIDFTDQRYLDKWLSVLIPYHYWYTRSMRNWAERTLAKPTLLANYSRTQEANQQYWEREGLPERLQGTLPIPGTDIHVRWPIGWLLPYDIYEVNKWAQPEKAEGAVDSMYRTLDMAGLGFNYAPDIMGKLLSGRGSEIQVGDYIWQYRMGHYAKQAVMGSGFGSGDEWWSGGDEFDQYRIARQVAVSAQGDINANPERRSELVEMGKWATDIAYQVLHKLGPLPEQPEEAEKVYLEAAERAGFDRNLAILGGNLLGIGAYRYTDEEAQLAGMSQQYNQLMYDPQTNPTGSRAAANQFVQDNPEVGLYWSKNAVVPESSNERPATRIITQRMYDEKQVVFDEMNAAVSKLLEADFARNRDFTVTAQQYNELTQSYWDRVNEIDSKYGTILENIPDAKAPGAAEGDPNRGMNPYEKAKQQVEAILEGGQKYPGKPEHPGDNATPEQMQQYYTAYADWDEARLRHLELVLGRVVSESGDSPDAVVSAMAKMVEGKYANDLLTEYKHRYQPPIVERWDKRITEKQAHTQAGIDARIQFVEQRLGDKAAQTFAKYNRLSGEDKEAFAKQNPHVYEAMAAAYNPEQYDRTVQLFGPDAFKAVAAKPDYPGENATEEQLEKYYGKLDAWRAQYPNAEEAELWIQGRNKYWLYEDVMTVLPEHRYDWGADYAAAQQFFGEDIYDIQRAYFELEDSSKARGAYLKEYPQLKGFWEWKRELSEIPDSMNAFPEVNWAARHSPQYSDSATYDPDGLTFLNPQYAGRSRIGQTEPEVVETGTPPPRLINDPYNPDERHSYDRTILPTVDDYVAAYDERTGYSSGGGGGGGYYSSGYRSNWRSYGGGGSGWVDYGNYGGGSSGIRHRLELYQGHSRYFQARQHYGLNRDVSPDRLQEWRLPYTIGNRFG